MNMKYGLTAIPKNRTILLGGIDFFNKSKCNTKHYLSQYSKSKKLCWNMLKKDYSTESDKVPPNIRLPPLMDCPKIVWPSIFKSMKNTILSYFIIKPYMDADFDLSQFVVGSKKAVEVVSKKLSYGEDLNKLVTDDIVPVLQSRLSIMSDAQKHWLLTDEEDIYFSFPYQVGIIFNEEESDQKRFVEILMVFHSLKGLAQMKARGEEIPLNIGFLPQYRSRICIANYRFVREYTKGVADDWTINLLNHFKPADDIDEG